MKRIVFPVAFVVAACCSLFAQPKVDNSLNSFGRVEQLMGQRHYTSAFALADSLRREAMSRAVAGSVDAVVSRQLLTSTWYMERAAINYQEDVADSSLSRFRAIVPYLTPVDRCLCHLFLGNIDSALADTLALRAVPNSHIAEFCKRPENARFNTTPTMYDLVMRLAVQQVPMRRKIELQRQLVTWYRHKPATAENTDLLLFNELQLIELLNQQPNRPTLWRRARVQDCLDRYRSTGNEQLAMLYKMLADFCEQDSDYLGAIAFCDSAVARWPKSLGGVDCANLKRRIQTASIDMSINEVSPAGRDILMRVGTRNVQRLYYRVIKYPEWYKDYYKSDADKRARLLSERVLKSWNQSFALPQDYKPYRHYGYIPALSPGHYMLLASPAKDFAAQGFCVRSFSVSAAAFVLMSSPGDSVYGYVVDYVTGEPVARQKVQLQRSRNYYDAKYSVVATAVTDGQGFFALGSKTDKRTYDYDYRVVTLYKGLEVVSNLAMGHTVRDTSGRLAELFLDRPVYRPGDTLQFLLVEGRVEHNRSGHAVGGDSVRVELRDVNFKAIDTLFGVTDAYGGFDGRFVIPAHVLPGHFVVLAYSSFRKDEAGLLCRKVFPVEAYKQPKFTVTLKGTARQDAEGRSVAPALGDSLVVEGLAASYTQVPVAGAKVVYSVSRDMVRPWWRRSYYYGGGSETVTLVADSLVTDAEGHFRIAFVAEPDSNVELSAKPCFSYQVQVEVTDINGETHSRTLSLMAGYENSYVALALPEQVSELNSVEYQYCDLNGTPLKGYVTLSVEKLRQPGSLWLHHGQLRHGVRHTLDREEFRKRFPLTAYSFDEELMKNWQGEKRVYYTRLWCEGLTANRVPLPVLEPGVYRVCVSLDEKGKDKVSDTAVVVYTPMGCREVHDMQLLWSDISHSTAAVGDTVVLRFGTQHSEVYAAYEFVCGDRTVERRLLRVHEGVNTLRIPVTEALIGGFNISLCAVKEGRDERENYWVEVPFEHKQLDVRMVSFRDKLTPGQRERWTLQVSPRRQGDTLVSPAALLLGMYDAALDSYGHGGNSFSWFPWQSNESRWAAGLSFSVNWHYRSGDDLLVPVGKYRPYEGRSPQGWTFTALNHRGWRWNREADSYGVQTESIVAMVSGTARGEESMATMQGNVRKRVMTKNAAVAVPEVTAELAVVEDEVEYSLLDDAAAKTIGTGGGEEKPYIRTNLSTLAFFEPTLRTDSDGTVSYSFTAPDLLTQWNVKGLAWTRELATGSLERQLVTRKELMIQPNMPRFLREGDTAMLMAKVMNLTDSDLTVTVDFIFTLPDGRGGERTLGAGRQEVSVVARGTVPVLFPVTVPEGGTVATYKYVATAPRHSDGEQGPLPLLTNRQAVTQSVSMYMNGPGAKQYTLRLPASATSQPVSFAVEYTANPLWLAIQSLPFMSECANPSNIYLFNSYYVNSVGKTIADRYPQLKHCADHATGDDSPLARNEDIKQTLLAETPWLRAGQSEVERLRNIARFYDSEALQRQCTETLDRLQKEQRPDGGWPWMPGGRQSSAYVTQHILKGLGTMARQMARGYTPMQNRALAFADREACRQYVEWMRYLEKHPGSQCKPIMLDYLYTRSYYTDRPFAADTKVAHDYFYSNAKQRYGDYTSLHDQALLALVFHRAGDTKLAREMVERIRQKALYSDEMGMYWRDNKAGYFYYQRPVETQALLIETFREVTPRDTHSVGQMQQWLLKQKQTTRWSSDIATLRAIQALMPNPAAGGQQVAVGGDKIVVRGKALADTVEVPVAGGSAGYLRHTYRADSLALLTAGHTVSATLRREAKGISWGSLYYQYTEQMDKIPASETGITLRRQLFRLEANGTPLELSEGTPVAVGDRLRVRLHLQCDRNLEYVELKEFRAACLEPVSTASGWVWHSGLSYYVAVLGSHNALYIDRLDKGKYIIDSDYYVTNPGSFTLAPSVLQCLYAPEFRATTPGRRITVK